MNRSGIWLFGVIAAAACFSVFLFEIWLAHQWRKDHEPSRRFPPLAVDLKRFQTQRLPGEFTLVGIGLGDSAAKVTTWASREGFEVSREGKALVIRTQPVISLTTSTFDFDSIIEIEVCLDYATLEKGGKAVGAIGDNVEDFRRQFESALLPREMGDGFSAKISDGGMLWVRDSQGKIVSFCLYRREETPGKTEQRT